MNREDIIRMAREVGFDDYEQDEMILRLSRLIAEDCAKRCDEIADTQDAACRFDLTNVDGESARHCAEAIREAYKP